MDHNFGDIAFVQFREMCELNEQSREIVKTPAQNPFTLVIVQIRKSELKIP